MEFAVPADNRVKLKESEKIYKYLDLGRELKKLRNMKVTIIPIVTGALGTVTKGLVEGLEDFKKFRNGWRPSKLLHCWDGSEYCEESCKLEETAD